MDNRRVENPVWYNDTKTQVMCNLIKEDGTRLTAVITKADDDSNPDWNLISSKYTTEHIDKNTNKHFQVVERAKLQKFEEHKLHIDKIQKEHLFNIKADAFEIDLIKNSTNREMKNKLRRAKSVLEAQILATLLYKEELEKQ